MAFYKSFDGVFEGSVEKVWKLIGEHTPQNIGNIHKGFVAKEIETKGNVMVRDVTAPGPDGKPLQSRLRFTANPPTGLVIEWLSGPMAGSWCYNSYVPQGPAKTKVETVGEFKIPGMDDASIHKMVNEFLDQGFHDDNNYLRKMR